MKALLEALIGPPGANEGPSWLAEINLLLVLVLVLWYVLTSITLVPFVASTKKRNGVRWAFIALLFSPLLALVALAAVPRRREWMD